MRSEAPSTGREMLDAALRSTARVGALTPVSLAQALGIEVWRVAPGRLLRPRAEYSRKPTPRIFVDRTIGANLQMVAVGRELGIALVIRWNLRARDPGDLAVDFALELFSACGAESRVDLLAATIR